jgi:hypothetical protein
MPVLYNSKMIIPGPLLDIRRETVRTEAGNIARQFYSIQAKGTLIAYKGSPRSDGSLWSAGYTPGPPDENIADASRLSALKIKMGALQQLFCQQGAWFEAQPFDGSASIKFQPRVKGISFANGKWYDTVQYTIDMEADIIFFGTTQLTCDVLGAAVPEETWSIEAADQIGRTYRVTHSISSQQKNFYAPDGSIPDGNWGWQRAQAIVIPQLGLDFTKVYAQGVLNLNGWSAFNYFRSQQIDEANGKFTVTETWLAYDNTQGTGIQMPPALDDFTVQSRLQSNGITQVTVEGTITGLETRDITTGAMIQTRWGAASMYFNSFVFNNILNRAANYSGLLLNPIGLLLNVGRNPIQGTISYSAQFDNRRIPMIPGAIEENITVTGEGGTDVFAVVPVLGRPWGPVLQGINTISEKTLAVNIEATMGSANMLSPFVYPPNTDGIILSFAPIALQVFRQRDQATFSLENGKYNRQVTFVYQ